MRSWGLKKAYKQLPVHSDSLSDSYLAVYNPQTRLPEIYGQKVLPFGSRSSVHGFCRVHPFIFTGLLILMTLW